MKWTNDECLIELTIAGNWRIEFLYLPRDQKKKKRKEKIKREKLRAFNRERG